MIQQLKNRFYKKFKTSFAKSGLDLQVFQMLQQKKKGFFVDIGSHHPIIGNNTFYFYLLGWKGICIDPNPEFIDLYKNKRPNDIFLNIGISDSNQNELEYYQLKKEMSVRNTFSKEYITKHHLEDQIEKIIPIEVKKLANVFEEQQLKNKTIDFLSIDCEGLDFEILKSNNWVDFRPQIICIETHDQLSNDLDSDVTKFMKSMRYNLLGKTLQGKHVGILFFMKQD